MAYTPVDADIGSYLRATASYYGRRGFQQERDGECRQYSVQRPRGSNSAPKFADDQDPNMTNEPGFDATRKVAENTAAGQAIGDPVVADPVDGDILTYTLTDSGRH